MIGGIRTLRELVEAEDEEGLVDLVAEDGGLDAVDAMHQYGCHPSSRFEDRI